MPQITLVSISDLLALQETVATRMAEHEYLEDAAQEYMNILCDELRESIVLARMFATIPYSKLPDKNRAFVSDLVESKNLGSMLTENTPVLSLLGSNGIEERWKDRRSSSGHIGIPLLSADFIDAIPMMSRLLKQMGFGLDWIDRNDTELVVKTAGKMGGVFHVRDAATEVDQKGRKIISAQDFVEAEKIKTVFGIGGGYLSTATFFTTVVFLNEFVERDLVERFMLQANKFKTATMSIAGDEKIFKPGS